MPILTRILAAAALVSILFADIAGASAATHYGLAAQRARRHERRVVNLEPDTVEKRSGRKRCKADTTTYSSSTSTLHAHHTTPHANPESLPTTTTATLATNTSPPTGGKKGIAWGADTSLLHSFLDQSVGVGYFYNWGAQPGRLTGIQSASMLWGEKNLADFIRYRDDYPILMGPNEFNDPGQSEMSPQEVATLWNTYIRPFASNKTLIAPSVTSAPGARTLLDDFFTECGGDTRDGLPNCGAHALSLHYYDTSAESLINYVQELHAYHPTLDVWLSEFACKNFYGDNSACTAAEAKAFMTTVSAFCEATSWISMYSPYGFTEDIGTVGEGNRLMTTSGLPTSLGLQFLQES